MIIQELFQQALNITEPQYIKDLQFDNENKRLDIYIDFKRGSSFSFKLIKDDKGTEIINNLKAYDTNFEFVSSFRFRYSDLITMVTEHSQSKYKLKYIIYAFYQLQQQVAQDPKPVQMEVHKLNQG